MSTRSAPSFAEIERFAAGHFGVARRLSLDQRGLHADRPCAVHRLVVLDRRRLSGRDRLQRLGHHQRHRRRDPDRRPDRGPRQSLARPVRRDPDQADRRRAGVRRRHGRDRLASDRRLSRAQAARLRRAGAGRGGDPQDRRPAMSPAFATRRARCTRSRRSAPIWAAWSAGTRPTGPGTAPATARASRSTARSSTGRRSRRWNRRRWTDAGLELG